MPNLKNGNCYLNFIASHDGVGMRPIEGILNKKKNCNCETGEAKKLQSGYGRGLEILAVSVTSFELFEALSFAVGERRAMSLSVFGGRNRRVRGEDLAHGRESSVRGR